MRDKNGVAVEIGTTIIVSRGKRGNDLIRAKVIQIKERLIGMPTDPIREVRFSMMYRYNPTTHPATPYSSIGYVRSKNRFLVAA